VQSLGIQVRTPYGFCLPAQTMRKALDDAEAAGQRALKAERMRRQVGGGRLGVEGLKPPQVLHTVPLTLFPPSQSQREISPLLDILPPSVAPLHNPPIHLTLSPCRWPPWWFPCCLADDLLDGFPAALPPTATPWAWAHASDVWYGDGVC